MNAKVVASATIKIGETSHEVLYFDPSPTESVDTIEIKSVGRKKTAYLPGQMVNSATLEVKILKGTVKPVAGSMVDLTIEVLESTDGGTPTASPSVTIPCFVQQVAEDRIEGDGASRLEAYVVTLQPTGLDEE